MNKQTNSGRSATSSRRQPLRSRLIERIRASHAHESQFLTVRRNPADWTGHDGIRRRDLARTELAQSSMFELAPGANLPHASGYNQLELVVLNGQALADGLALNCGDALCMPHNDALRVSAGPEGARIYARFSRPDQPTREVEHFSALTDDASWLDFCPGVRIKPLWDGGERRSVLVRMEAGAHVNAHGHALEEECMMLGGEAFIGDTLLRSDEYQLAPQGSRHGAITTDVGALFYVHGSLDPSAYT